MENRKKKKRTKLKTTNKKTGTMGRRKTFSWSKGPEERMFRLLRTIKFPNILYCTQTLILATKIP